MSRGRRFFEFLKTLLMLALFISAMLLTYKTWVYSDKFLEDPSLRWLKDLASSLRLYNEPVAIMPSIIDVELSAASYPIKAAVTNSHGRFGAVYDFTASGAVYARVSDALGEALGSSSEPEAIDETQWQAALLSRGVYLEFPDAVPLSALCEWLGNNPPDYPDALSKRIILTGGADGLAELYYIDKKTGAYLKCKTGAAFHAIEDGLADFMPNGAKYAFETDDYEPVNKFTLLSDPPKEAYMLSAGAPERTDEHKYTILKSMAFNPNTDSKFPEPDGTEVFVDNTRTLRLTTDGEVLYHHADDPRVSESGLSIRQRGDTPALPEIIEAARALSYEVLLPGETRLCLSSVTVVGSRVTVEFDYVFDGMRVFLNSGKHAARITVDGGVITEARLYMRTYTRTDERTALPSMDTLGLIFPERDDFYLMLGYFDDGSDLVRAKWYAD